MQENNKSFEITYDTELPSNDIGNVGDIYIQILEKKKEYDYMQDDAYIYANKSGDNELIGLATTLIMIGFIIGYFLFK